LKCPCAAIRRNRRHVGQQQKKNDDDDDKTRGRNVLGAVRPSATPARRQDAFPNGTHEYGKPSTASEIPAVVVVVVVVSIPARRILFVEGSSGTMFRPYWYDE